MLYLNGGEPMPPAPANVAPPAVEGGMLLWGLSWAAAPTYPPAKLGLTCMLDPGGPGVGCCCCCCCGGG